MLGPTLRGPVRRMLVRGGGCRERGARRGAVLRPNSSDGKRYADPYIIRPSSHLYDCSINLEFVGFNLFAIVVASLLLRVY